ncbi:MAG: tripartite tricarboxylate transporter TctB family protein [Spirochaetaceae bacterium]|nr:MAG: tripartite tricarboxylate transporter TctB family protein [Spirochaetaceae bacterium]
MQASRKELAQRVLLALAVAGLGLAVLHESARFSALAAVFPRVVGVSLVILAALLLMQSILGKGLASGHSESMGHFAGGSRFRSAGFVVVLLCWAFLLPTVGFIVTSSIAFVGILLIATERGTDWRITAKRAVLGLIVIGFFYGLFSMLLNVPLPRGRLWALL